MADRYVIKNKSSGQPLYDCCATTREAAIEALARANYLDPKAVERACDTGEFIVEYHPEPKLEPETLALFLYIAGQAGEWDGTPPIEGLRVFSNEDKGRFMHLKKVGLLTVFEKDPDNHQIEFTNAGVVMAGEHGVEIR